MKTHMCLQAQLDRCPDSITVLAETQGSMNYVAEIRELDVSPPDSLSSVEPDPCSHIHLHTGYSAPQKSIDIYLVSLVSSYLVSEH